MSRLRRRGMCRLLPCHRARACCRSCAPLAVLVLTALSPLRCSCCAPRCVRPRLRCPCPCRSPDARDRVQVLLSNIQPMGNTNSTDKYRAQAMGLTQLGSETRTELNGSTPGCVSTLPPCLLPTCLLPTCQLQQFRQLHHFSCRQRQSGLRSPRLQRVCHGRSLIRAHFLGGVHHRHARPCVCACIAVLSVGHNAVPWP